MKEQVKKYWLELTSGIKTMFKEFFNKETNKKQRANMWSFSRLILIIPILICSILAIITQAAPLLIATSSLVLLGEITDIFDGASARKHESTSDFGKLLDQVVDKTFSSIVILTLSLINPMSLVMLLGETLIVASTIPYNMKYKNITDTSTFIGKVKQFPLSASFIIGYLSPINNVLHAISTTFIIITLLLQITTALSYLKRNNEWVKEHKYLDKKNNLIEIEEVFEKTNQLEKTVGEKNNNNINITSKKDLYINLRNLLIEITDTKQDKNIKQYKKTKND